MCGNLGYASGSPTVKDMTFFKQALYVDALRGKDSTGVLAINEKNEISILKNSLEAADFINTPAFKKFTGYLKPHKLMMGHNRAATTGAIIDKNAHPFRHNHITMAHNGSLWFHDNLHKGSDFTVDSEAIAYNLATKGTVDTLEKLAGAYALVWHNATTNTLHMARNEDRPLTVAISKDEKSIYWASEYNMLSFLLARVGIEVAEYYDITPGIIHSFDLDSDFVGSSYSVDEEFEDGEQVDWGGTNSTSVGKPQARFGGGYWNSYGYPMGDDSDTALFFKGQCLDVEVEKIIPYHFQSGLRGKLITVYEGVDEVMMYNVEVDKFAVGDTIRVVVETDTIYSTTAAYKYHIPKQSKQQLTLQVDHTDDTIIDAVVGYNDILITEKDFKKNTQDGCSWCTGNVTIKDASDITWLSENQFLCPNCTLDDITYGGYSG